MKLDVFYGLLLVFLCDLANSIQSTSLQIDEAKLRSFVNNVLSCYDITGLGLAMTTKSKTIFADGFGVKTVAGKEPVNGNTIFNVGSVTKSFTATIAADAVAQGKIDWDRPLKDTFDDLKLSDSFRTEKATLRDVLGHKMGVPMYWGATTVAENITRQEMVKRLQFYTNICDLRTEYRYSNQMVVAGAAAVEIATCQYWEDAVADKIYKPLGMSDSRLVSRMTDKDWSNAAISHTTIRGKHVPNPEQEQAIILDYMGPAGGVYSSAVDMAKYLRFHLNGGKDDNGKQVIPTRELEETHKPNFRTTYTPYTQDIYPVHSSIDDYGMGWRTGYYRGLSKVEHTGSYSGYTCRNTFLPDAGVGVWVCEASAENGGYTANQAVSWFALDILLGKDPWLNESTSCTFPAPWVKPPTRPPPRPTTVAPTTKYPQSSCGVNYTEFVGDYNHKAFGTFSVFTDADGDLQCSSGRLLKCSMVPINCLGKFRATIKGVLTYRDPSGEGGDVQFSDFKQNVGYLSVSIPYFDGSFPPLFQRGNEHKPIDYPAGRGPLSAICKQPKRRNVSPTSPTVGSSAVALRPLIVLTLMVSILCY